MINEKTGIDQYVRKCIEAIGISPDEQGTINKEIKIALKGASKSKAGVGFGKPEFLFFSKDFLVIIEDKKSSDKLICRNEDDDVLTDFPYRNDYAVNGAIHYAKHICNKTITYKKIFAIGAVKNNHSYQFKPFFLSDKGMVELSEIKSFEDFSEENIDEYYKVAVLGELPKEDREIKDVNKIASDLHEDLRNYGQLEGEKKATVVSAILLALEEPTFDLKVLKGSKRNTDGNIIFSAIKTYLDNEGIVPYSKVGILLDQFAFLKNDVTLNSKNIYLNMSPLQYFAKILKKKIFDKIKNNTEVDILGNFYGEFVKYGGNDGNSLGIVLTPRHITSLMVELIKINYNDFVLDPACGTGAFLVSAMNKMLKQTSNEKKRSQIKRNQLYGIEIQQKLFTIATTNMILRGDGKSNLQRDDCFNIDKEKMKSYGINKVLMNPPYSQAKTKETRYLSELNFIYNALNMMKLEGKLCVIIPQSSMVGKTKEDKELKKVLLQNHTLESVITLNKDTFHGIGVNPCIAVFTSGIPHPSNKMVKFINYEDDGYIIRKHIGLVGNGSEKGKKEHLLNVLDGNEDDSTKFIVKSTVSFEDEWLHSFYYFNDEIPSESQFEKTIADYLTFQFDMYSHDKKYMFEEKED